MRDELKDYPDSVLYMIGAIDKAREKAKMKGEDENLDGKVQEKIGQIKKVVGK